MRIITWNIYQGQIQGKTINGQPAVTPVQRLNIILQIAQANNVDAVFIQELPAGGALPAGTVLPGGWQSATISEHQAGAQPLCSNFNTTYGFFWNTATVNVANPVIARMNPLFTQITGCIMRTPVYLNMVSGGVNYTAYNWHNEAPNVDADRGLSLLAGRIGNAVNPPVTVVAGDFNRTSAQVDQYFNNNWTDIVAAGPGGQNGVDHILTNSQNGNGPILGNVLDFTSDAYHWPIAGDI
jgi:hypothetical protein